MTSAFSKEPPLLLQASGGTNNFIVCILDRSEDEARNLGNSPDSKDGNSSGDDDLWAQPSPSKKKGGRDSADLVMSSSSNLAMSLSRSAAERALLQLPVIICDNATDPQRFSLFNNEQNLDASAGQLQPAASDDMSPHSSPRKGDAEPKPATNDVDEDAPPDSLSAKDQRTMRLTVSANGTIARQTMADCLPRGSCRPVLAHVLAHHVASLWDNEDVLLLHHMLVPATVAVPSAVPVPTRLPPGAAAAPAAARTAEAIQLAGVRDFRIAVGQLLHEAAQALVAESSRRTTSFYRHAVSLAITILPRKPADGSGKVSVVIRVPSVTPTLPEPHRKGNAAMSSLLVHKVTLDTLDRCSTLPALVAQQYERAALISGDGNEVIVFVLSLTQQLDGHKERTARMHILDLGQRVHEDPLLPLIQASYRRPDLGPVRPNLPNTMAALVAKRSGPRKQPSQGSTASGSPGDHHHHLPAFRINYDTSDEHRASLFDAVLGLGQSTMDDRAGSSSTAPPTSSWNDSDLLQRLVLHVLGKERTLDSELAGSCNHIYNLLAVPADTLFDAVDHIHSCTVAVGDAPFVVEDSFLDCLELLEAYKAQRRMLKSQRRDLNNDLVELRSKNKSNTRRTSLAQACVLLHPTEYRRRNSAAESSSSQSQNRRNLDSSVSIFALDGVLHQATTSGLRVAAMERNLEAARRDSAAQDAKRKANMQTGDESLESARQALAAAAQRLRSTELRCISDAAMHEHALKDVAGGIERDAQAFLQSRKTTLFDNRPASATVPLIAMTPCSEMELLSAAKFKQKSRAPAPPNSARSGTSGRQGGSDPGPAVPASSARGPPRGYALPHALALRQVEDETRFFPLTAADNTAPAASPTAPAASPRDVVACQPSPRGGKDKGRSALEQPDGIASLVQRRAWLKKEIGDCRRACAEVEVEVVALHKHKSEHATLHGMMIQYRLLSERVLQELMLLANTSSAVNKAR